MNSNVKCVSGKCYRGCTEECARAFYGRCTGSPQETYMKVLFSVFNHESKSINETCLESLKCWLYKFHRYSVSDPKCSLFTSMPNLDEVPALNYTSLLAFYYTVLRCDRTFEKRSLPELLSELQLPEFGQVFTYQNDVLRFYPSPHLKDSSIIPQELTTLLVSYMTKINYAVEDNLLEPDATSFDMAKFHKLEDNIRHGVIYDPDIVKRVNRNGRPIKGDWLGWVDRESNREAFIRYRMSNLSSLVADNRAPNAERSLAKTALNLLTTGDKYNRTPCQQMMWHQFELANSKECTTNPPLIELATLRDPVSKAKPIPMLDKQFVFGTEGNIEMYRECRQYFRVDNSDENYDIDDRIDWNILNNKWMVSCAMTLPLLFPVRFVIPSEGAYGHYNFAKFPLQMDERLPLTSNFLGALRVKVTYRRNSNRADYQDRIILIFENNNKYDQNKHDLFDYHEGSVNPRFILTDWKYVKYGYGSFPQMINPTWDEFNILLNYLHKPVFRHPEHPNLFFFSNYTKSKLLDILRMSDNNNFQNANSTNTTREAVAIINSMEQLSPDYFITHYPYFKESGKEYLIRLHEQCTRLDLS